MSRYPKSPLNCKQNNCKAEAASFWSMFAVLVHEGLHGRISQNAVPSKLAQLVNFTNHFWLETRRCLGFHLECHCWV